MDTTKIIKELTVTELFKPNRTIAWERLSAFLYPWEALLHIKDFIVEIGSELNSSEYEQREGSVWIHKTATIAPSASIGSFVIIGENANIRHGAYIRENAIVGSGAVVGNSTELKNVILFDNAQVPHYNYVGDSILGYKSHMGAGAITSNLKNDRSNISIIFEDSRVETGLRKFGAILGDDVEVGCNSVLNPGSVIGAGSWVYPLSFVRGWVPKGRIYKRQGEIVEMRNEE